MRFRSVRSLVLTSLALIGTAASAQKTIHIPADQPTIQAGIDAATNGDTVLVAPGNYVENIDFRGRAITVTSSGGAATTTIDGSNNAPTVTFQSGEQRTSVLSGFTIQNGAEGGVGYGQLTGGIAIRNSSPSIQHNVVTHNHANNIRVSFGSPLIEDNVISYSIAGSGKSLSDGSGLYIELAACTSSPPNNCVTVLHNTIENNARPAFGVGGGIAIDGSADVLIDGNRIQNNSAYAGAGISTVNTDSVDIANNLIIQNLSTFGGSGIDLQPPYFTVGPFSGLIANNTIANNTGGPQINVSYNVSLFLFVNNIVVANGSTAAVACTAPIAGTTPASFDHNDIYNPAGGAFSGCDIPSGLYGNISVDPLFVNSTSDFHLSAGSPAIDAGNSSTPLLSPTDLDGNPRFGNTGPSGYEIIDMGAYEHSLSASHSFPVQTSIYVTPSAYIQTTSLIQLTANLASPLGTPTGNVTFLVDNQAAGSSTLNAMGVATFDTSGLAVGTHVITAQYGGTSIFSPAVSVKFYVQIQNAIGNAPSTTTIRSSLNPSTVGQSVTFTVHVSSLKGVPTGFFSITDSASNIGALVPVDANGDGVWTPTLARGPHTITATYNPDPGFATSTGTLFQQVDGLPDTIVLTATPTTATLGSSIALTVTVTPSSGPTGTVTFLSNAIILGIVPLVNGTATLATTTLTLGANNIRAVYSGDTTYDIAVANITVNITVQPTTLTLASSANPSPALVPVTFTAQLFANTGPATIAGVPVVFTIDGKIAATITTDSQGSATLTTSALATGTHTLSASFAGDLIHGPSASAPLTESVTPDATVTTVLPPMGTITQLDRPRPLAVLRSNYLFVVPTGSVTIFEGTTALNTVTLTSGGGSVSNASIPLGPLTPGTHILVAVYTPDTTSFLPSQSVPFTLIVVPASFTLTLSEPNLTLQTGHHHTETVSLTSSGGLGGSFNLTCGAALPEYTTCTWAQNSVTLPINGTVSTSLTIDTDQLLSFLAENRAEKPDAPFVARTLRHGWAATTLATLIPFVLFGLRRRHKLRPLLSLLLLATLATTLTACGASKYPASTAPGTYIIPVTAAGPPAPGGVSPSQTVNLTLVVTP